MSVSFLIYNLFVNFVGMKRLINWKEFVVLFIVIGCIYYLTRSWLITGGILAILLLIDGLLRQYDHKKRGEKHAEDIKNKLEEQDD